MIDEQHPRSWRIHGERTIYDNPWIRLTLVDVEPPGLDRFEHHVVRLHKVAIAAVLDEHDRVLMLHRYRFIPDRWGWELPGGIVEQDEEPAAAVTREVTEETGWKPAFIDHVITYEPMIGMIDSPHDIFIGGGAIHVGEPSDKEEVGQIDWIPLTEIPGMMRDGTLLGSGTLVGLLHLLAFKRP